MKPAGSRWAWIAGVALLLALGVWFGLSDGWEKGALVFKLEFGPMLAAGLVFTVGTGLLLCGTHAWLGRVDAHPLLNSHEKLQNKDALVIGAFFAVVMLLGLCVTGAAAATLFPSGAGGAVVQAISWALASAAVGGAFGFLLGHPRRLASDEMGRDERRTVNNLLRTGLDDVVDWLVKGLTTVLLVNAVAIIKHLEDVANVFAKGFSGTQAAVAASFAQPVIVFFTLLGALAACLVTRTYLTGALSRADRSTTGAFQRAELELGEFIMLQAAQRSLTTQQTTLSAAIRKVAEKLAGLSLEDLKAAPEFAMWAKANSMLGKTQEALEGYERAVRLSECDATLLLDYGVALHLAKNDDAALAALESAKEHLSPATPELTRKNVFKSLSFQLLYHATGYDEVLKLIAEYRAWPGHLKSGGLLVNEACAWGQRFRAEAAKHNAIATDAAGKAVVPFKLSRPEILEEVDAVREARAGALAAMKAAVAHDSRWKLGLRTLFLSAATLPGTDSLTPVAKPAEENDLECFERMDDFRLLLDLPPFREAATPPPGARAGNAVESGAGESRENHVATEAGNPPAHDLDSAPPGSGS